MLTSANLLQGSYKRLRRIPSLLPGESAEQSFALGHFMDRIVSALHGHGLLGHLG